MDSIEFREWAAMACGIGSANAMAGTAAIW